MARTKRKSEPSKNLKTPDMLKGHSKINLAESTLPKKKGFFRAADL
jgi:hypothetical protein